MTSPVGKTPTVLMGCRLSTRSTEIFRTSQDLWSKIDLPELDRKEGGNVTAESWDMTRRAKDDLRELQIGLWAIRLKVGCDSEGEGGLA